jgi:small ligand-binding sensory domain FIST
MPDVARFGDGIAHGPDLTAAAERAAKQALGALRGRRADVAWVFVSGPDPEQVGDALERAAAVTGARTSLGAGSPSVAASSSASTGSAVAVLVGVLPGVKVRSFHLEVMRVAAGLAVVGLPEPRPEDELALLLADPWSFPADGFAARVSQLTPGTPVVGGLVSGAAAAGDSRMLVDGRVVQRGAVGALLSGPVAARIASAPSSLAIGPPMTVTKVEGNDILGLAGSDAAIALERVLGDLDPGQQALASRGLQLGVAVDEYADAHLEGDYVLRPVIGVDRILGAVSIGEPVETGATVRFHMRDPEGASRQLHRAAQGLITDTGFDTVEAVLVLGSDERADDLAGDVKQVAADLSGPALLAASVAGELVPMGGRVTLQGWTTTLLAFGSGSAAARGTSR